MSSAGKYAHVLTVRSHMRIGAVVYSSGTTAPAAADAYGAATAQYMRVSGSLSTTLYITADSGANWSAVTP
jgi:hypothetical protein